MRIAFLNRGRETHPGGDLIQIDETIAALGRIGVEIIETGWDAERIASGNFDLCHMFHCNFDWSWGNYQAIRKAGKKYVLTPIYYKGFDGGLYADQINEMLYTASAIMPFSECEKDELPGPNSMFSHRRTVIRIIPNGTSRVFHCKRPTAARAANSVVTISSRGITDKNCAKIESASKLAGAPFYLITDFAHDLVIDVLKESKVFVNASESERMSLTIGEALCAGCRVLATKENRGNEWYGPGLYTFDPKESVEVLAERIRTAYECSDDDWDWSPNIKARKLTWDLTAAMLKQVYEEVLAQ